MRERIRMPELRCGFARWPRGRKVEWYFNDRFSRWLLDSVEAEMQAGQYYTALHLMLLGIEVLSGFLDGRRPDLETFSAFVEKYMSPALRARVRTPPLMRGMAPPALDGKAQLTVAELLWASPRSGYRDACAAFPGASIAEHSRYFIRCYSRVGVRIDIRKFHRDFLAGFRKYYADVYSDYLVRQRFLARFDQLFGGRGKGGTGAPGRGREG
ncbi:MAG: hypothetical protein WCP22_05890 [Chlamydiota bacterium]